MRIEKENGTVIEIPNWLVVVLGLLAVSILVPAIAIIGPLMF